MAMPDILFLAAASGLVLAGDAGAQAHASTSTTAPTHQEESMNAATPSDYELVLTQTFAAPRAVVFEAMTSEEHLPHWLGSTGITLTECKVDARAGGSFVYVFKRPSGRRLEVRGAYDAFDAPSGYSYTETYDFSPLKILVTATFEASGDKTLYTQRMRYGSRQERDEDYEPVTTSARDAHANLARYLEELSRR
jgi:uncharacterized protein YndB with AHSA1/START domain